VPAGAARSTYSVDYIVRISARDPGHARVRWLLAGIDEIKSFRLVFRDDRISGVTGTGALVWQGRTLRWTPGGPYAHLRYTVAIDRTRPPGPHFDSHATPDWIATRAFHLFPEINVTFAEGADQARPRARLLFRLPSGWRSAAAGVALEGDTFALEEPGKRFARPRGWFLLGRIDRQRRRVGGLEITVATAPGSSLDARRLLRLYARTVPVLAGAFGPPPARVLVVSAPDPMWRGGLSGEDSFFVHGHIPLRSADRTSTYLHELVHVWQPFRSGPDAQWIAEGLAEYYALAAQHRAGRLSDAGFARGLALFARYGRWGLDLTRTRDGGALNNSAPLVMHWIDQEIRRATRGRRSLDDAVRLLGRERTPITTARFVRVVSRTVGSPTGDTFGARLARQVVRGEPPPTNAGH
jgi:predicted metalloprotease with PDZ domain